MLKKEITFIYMDSVEKAIMEVLADEAKTRGYIVRLTNNKFERCEIGVYCQHVNFPQFSKFSIVMLHDIIQQYGNWPDIWTREPWNKYDIGILPSDQWVDNWNKCSQYFYSRPKVGMFKIGWPKADKIAKIKSETYRNEFYIKYGLDPLKKTVLYAPAWENDNKQDDFVQSMLPLDVNILIKQYPATPEVQPQQYKNIMEMYELHKNNKRVTILDSNMNIFNAIAASDVLVSEESSTMCEATMMGIPAVSVSNWLIPDVIPSRYPECNYEFVTVTQKEELTNCVYQIIENYEVYRARTEEFCNTTFCNIGKSSSMIIDIIDDVISNRPIRYSPLRCQKKSRVPFCKYRVYIKERFFRTFYFNYAERFAIFKLLWNFLRLLYQPFKYCKRFLKSILS